MKPWPKFLANFLNNDMTGILKKHKKEWKDVPDISEYIKMCHEGQITRNKLREIAEEAINEGN